MAHDVQHLVVRNDHYTVPEMLNNGVVLRESSGMLETPAHLQKRALPQPPEPREKRRSRSKSYFICAVHECKEKFSSRENLETHMKLHQVIKPFTCNTCGKVCKTERRLNIHQERHAFDGEKCKCDICERSFSSSSSLKKHKLRIHRPLPHICPYCQAGFEEHRYMAIHAKRAHDKDPAEATEDEHSILQLNFESSDLFTQDVDDGKSSLRSSYISSNDDGSNDDDGNLLAQSTSAASSSVARQKEQKLSGCDASSGEKTAVVVTPTITCGMCTSTFPSLSYLEQHMAVHINEKILICQHCEMKFTNHQLLSNHLKLHNFEPEPTTSFSTNFINGNFAQYPPLSGQPTVTRGPQVVGKYICALCSEQFLNLGSLKRHQAKGHNSIDLSI